MFSLKSGVASVALALLLTGCGVQFDTNIADGTSLNNNHPKIVFTAQDKKAKLILKHNKRRLTVNGINRTGDTSVKGKKPGRALLRYLYNPRAPRLLPEGNVTIVLKVPYRRSHYLKKYFGITDATATLHLFIDTLPPEINALSPQNGTVIHRKMQPLVFKVSDAGSGVDAQSLKCSVGGEDWSALCRYQEGNYTLTPDASHPLPRGDFNVTVQAADRLGNRALHTFTFTGIYDQTPPQILMLDPTPGAVITDPLHPLLFQITDDANGTGVDPATVRLRIPEANLSVPLHPDANDSSRYRYQPDANRSLPYGYDTLLLNASDRAGNEANASFSIFVREKETLSAAVVATPSSAYAPATIRFSPKVSTDNAIQTYSWDFDGDGTWDRSSIFPESYTWSYSNPGNYTVRLKVVDVNGKTATGEKVIHIMDAPPSVSVDLSPSNGPVPLAVTFRVHASDHEGIALYEWDFDGDGTWDYNSTQSGDVTHTYTQTGLFNARLRVTDTQGASTVYVTPTTTVLAQKEGDPTVTAEATPLSGPAPLNVHFDANASDPQNKGFALYEWDFDGDGTWDYNSTQSPAVDHTYTAAGHFYPRIRVTTHDGRTTYDAVEITVNQQITLSVSTDTIDPGAGESVEIHTRLSADAQVQLVIEDALHNPVRTLVDWGERAAGDYTDTWDGTADNGAVVREGPYYAVIYYREDQQIKHVDLRESSGGARFNPSRTEAPYTFYPYDYRPLRITFTLNRAAEVISFIGYSYSNTRVITFRNRQPLGRGSYTDIWYSQNDDGVMVTPPPGRYFLYGVWAYTLADNAVFVKSGVRLSGLSVSPAILSPSSHDEEGKQDRLLLRFTLNGPADVELTVLDAQTGAAVAGREYKNLSEGENEIRYDGRDNNGVWLRPGTYTLGLRAVDERGYRSLTQYTIMRVAY